MTRTTARDVPQVAAGVPPTDHRTREAVRLLAAVAAAYLVVQLLLVGVGRSTGFDEAVYLSEASTQVASISWGAHRALGLIGLLKPAMWLELPLAGIRLWLAALSSVGLWFAFWPWTRTIGRSAALAAGVFASCWVSLLYGTEVYPNLHTALGVVAAVGWATVPRVTTRRGVQLLAVVASVAVVTVLRPADSVWLALLLVGALPWLRRDDRIVTLLAAGAGALVGAVPWLVESVVRFGGPAERIADMRGAVLSVDPGRRLLSYLGIALERTSAGDVDPSVDAPVVLWFVLIVGLAALGAARPHRPGAAAAVRVAAVGGIVFAAAYVVLTDAVYVRFLLPSWGLVSLPVAVGLRTAWGGRRGVLAGLVLAGLAGWWLAGQAVTTRIRIADITARNERTAQLAAAVADRVSSPCYLFSDGDYPSLGYLTGCMAGWYRPDADRPFRHDPNDRAEAGYAVYAVDDELTGPIASWPRTPLQEPEGWYLLELPDAP